MTPRAAELLREPDALLTRTHLRELGLERRAVDAVFRTLPVIVLPGYSRPLIRAADYRRLLDDSTYDGSRVRLPGSTPLNPHLSRPAHTPAEGER